MNNGTMSRRQVVTIVGLGAVGALLAACAGSPATPTAVPGNQGNTTVPATPEPRPTATPVVSAGSTTPTLAPATVVSGGTQPAAIPTLRVPTGNTLEGFTAQRTNPPQKVELLYWWGNDYQPAMQFTNQIIARFSVAYPNVIVKPVAGQHCDAFVTAAAAGTPPDLFHTWDCVERMGNFARRQMIIPLDDYIRSSHFDLDDYLPGLMDTCKMDGKIWGMVDSAGIFLLWTRPLFFTEIGEKENSLPKDTDELWTLAKKLTTRDSSGNIKRIGIQFPSSFAWIYFAWIATYGGVIWDTNSGQPTPDHPGVIAALSDLVSQAKDYGVENIKRWASSVGKQKGAQKPFLAGNEAMEVNGDWSGQDIFNFHADWKVGHDYGVAALPPAPTSKQQGDSAVVWWSWPWVLPSHTKQPDWSWELLRYFLSPAYQLYVHPEFKEMVVRKSMLDSERLWWPAVQTAREIVRSGRKLTTMLPMNPVAAQYQDLLGAAFEKVLYLTVTPEKAMADVKEQTITALKQAGV